MGPRVSIIIVSWNVADLVADCLRSLPLSDPTIEVIVVDSASHDGTPARVAAEFPLVKLIACSENVGYSRGNNLGFAQARGDYWFVLNPDTVLEADALEALCAQLDAHADIGCVGPALTYGDGTPQSSRRRFPTLSMAILETAWLRRFAPRGLLERYQGEDWAKDRAVDVDWLVGAALLLRADAVRKVGGFDEGYFMYSEELDLCRRLKAAGWRIVHEPAAHITHYEARSSGQARRATHLRYNRSKIRYFNKHHGPWQAGVLRLALQAAFAWQSVLEAGKWLLGHKRALRAQRVSDYLYVLVRL